MYLNDNQLNTHWRLNKDSFDSKAAHDYIFEPGIPKIATELRRTLCSYNEAVELEKIGFNTRNDRDRGPFFYYEMQHWSWRDVDEIQFIENNVYVTSYYDIIKDNAREYSSDKIYIIYTFDMIINDISKKYNIDYKILKSPLDKSKFLIWVYNSDSDETIEFLRSDENSIEWTDISMAATKLYNFYKQYWYNE